MSLMKKSKAVDYHDDVESRCCTVTVVANKTKLRMKGVTRLFEVL